MTNTETIIEAFATVGREEILKWTPLNSCIASTRVTIECLARFGVVAKAIATTLVIQCHAHNLAYTMGLSPEEKRQAQQRAGSFLQLTTDNPYDGHVIAYVPGEWLIDTSFDQASVAGFPLERQPLVVPLEGLLVNHPPEDIQLRGKFVAGTCELDVFYRTNARDRSFESAPAWETDHLQKIILPVIRKMKRALEQ